MRSHVIRQILLAIVLGVFIGPLSPAIAVEEPQGTDAPSGNNEELGDIQTAPVVVDGIVLFRVRGISFFPAEKRAKKFASKIKAVAANPSIAADSLRIDEDDGTSQILSGKNMIVRVFDADAALEGVERQILAEAIQSRIIKSIERWRYDRNPKVLKGRVLYALGATLIFALILWAVYWLNRRMQKRLKDRIQKKFHDVQIQKLKVVSRYQLMRTLIGLTNLLWIGIIIVVGYLYLIKVLSLFPWTRGFVRGLLAVLIAPLRTLGQGLVQSFPDLVFLIVLFFVSKYILKMIRMFFKSLADGSVKLSGFDVEWAWPTYRLVRLLLIVFALVVAYPYIPGSSSAAFKGVSIFMGVLFSIGSSAFIGNIVAGYSMTYRRAFKVGQRIKIGEHTGNVEQIRLLVTHLRTPKNEEVVIPNSSILDGEVINYSTLGEQQGVILHTTVGIGYETPWRQVEAMLIEAAKRTPDLQFDPPPFVHVKSLGDFCVIYEINVYCTDPLAMNRHYTELHRNILDIFNEYGVQIMTPAYKDDPVQPKLVDKKDWYASPAKPPDGVG